MLTLPVKYAGHSPLWTPRWYPLKAHPIQTKLMASKARFCVVPAGRRSGKTERGKRKGVIKAYSLPPGGRVGFGAPTRDQAKNIFWDDLKKMIPRSAMTRAPLETDLAIMLKNGVELRVVGMDRPERVEGMPWDWFLLDEYANCKESAWAAHLYPALSTIGREGGAWLIGVPEGRNHYYDTYKRAQSDDSGEWEAFTWLSEDILPAKTIAQARRDLDPLTFEQEYRASLVNFQGQAYYSFNDALHAIPCRDRYRPDAPLKLCFDFNVDPGICVIMQDMKLPHPEPVIEPVMVDGRKLFGTNVTSIKRADIDGTGIIGEVYIPRNSTTPAVCKKIIQDWGKHAGRIMLYGDATGGARGSAQTEGSNWDLIMRDMYAHFGRERTHRFGRQNPSSGLYHNPTERARVNAVNTRLLAGDGTVRLVVDPKFAPNVVRDFEGVRLLEGGSGEIDKKSDLKLTHLTDGLGYSIEYDYPTITGPRSTVVKDFV